MDHKTEQDAGLLEQAASMLESLANDERNRGNCSAPAAVAEPAREDRAAWFALAMGAAASIEDAANCLRDEDAKNAAMGAAKHVRESCNKLWWAAPSLEAPAADEEPPLCCDTCGKACPDPWHYSTAVSRHMHACDACHGHGLAPAAPASDLALIVAALEHGQPQMAHYAEPRERHAQALAAARRMAAAPQAPAAPVTPAAAMAALKAAFASDPEYAWSWHCGAWACAHDEGLDTGAANRAAARLMHMAFGCDTSKHPNFLDAHRTAAPAAPAVDASDTALLDAMTQHRIALVPEFEGPWDAELYEEGEEPRHVGSGATPREALRAALAAQAKEGGA